MITMAFKNDVITRKGFSHYWFGARVSIETNHPVMRCFGVWKHLKLLNKLFQYKCSNGLCYHYWNRLWGYAKRDSNFHFLSFYNAQEAQVNKIFPRWKHGSVFAAWLIACSLMCSQDICVHNIYLVIAEYSSFSAKRIRLALRVHIF